MTGSDQTTSAGVSSVMRPVSPPPPPPAADNEESAQDTAPVTTHEGAEELPDDAAPVATDDGADQPPIAATAVGSDDEQVPDDAGQLPSLLADLAPIVASIEASGVAEGPASEEPGPDADPTIEPEAAAQGVALDVEPESAPPESSEPDDAASIERVPPPAAPAPMATFGSPWADESVAADADVGASDDVPIAVIPAETAPSSPTPPDEAIGRGIATGRPEAHEAPPAPRQPDDGHEGGGSPASATVRTRRRRTLIILAVIVAAVAAGWWLLNRSDAEPVGDAAPETILFADVVVTDLQDVQEFDGTLGFTESDAIISRRDGTLTSAGEEGAIVSAGEVAYSVDGEPVVLLAGALPAWRDIGFDDEPEALAGRAAGTITAVVPDDTELFEGDILYYVDGEPVVLLYGELPAWRTLDTRVEGADVEQLETALVRLGYDEDGDVTVDEEYTSATADMVERWQEDIGLEVTGTVPLGSVIFVDGPVTVDEAAVTVGTVVRDGDTVVLLVAQEGISGDDVAQLEEALADLGYDPGPIDGTFDQETEAAVRAWQADLGAEVDGVVHLGEVVFVEGAVRVTERLIIVGRTVRDGDAVLATSSSESFVTIDLPASDQGILAEGDAVRVELPDGAVTTATVVSVATVATGGTAGGQQTEATFEIVVVLDDSSLAAGFDEAPVDVEVVVDERVDVVAIPVTALISLREGGYAVEVERAGGTTALIAVDPGFFADGLVEIRSGALIAGDRIVIP
jgi:peptidoglycan hydrolase-like protein with peptidoglycan-binding domain